MRSTRLTCAAMQKNFRITDEHLGEGGPKAKFQANVNAIRLLKELEAAGQQASPEQQEVLSRYVGWGGIPDAFDPEKPAWASEYTQLKELLTPEEYAAARSSTLNAHYTSPTVIKAIYDAVGRMGFEIRKYSGAVHGCGQFLWYAAGENAKQPFVWCGAGPDFRAHRKAALSQGGHHSRRLLRPLTGVTSLTLPSAMCLLVSIRSMTKLQQAEFQHS